MMKTLLYFFAFFVLAVFVVRLWPVNSEDYHVDPAEPDPQRSEVRMIGPDAPRFKVEADVVLRAFSDIATATSGVRLVEGSVDEGMMTFMARSAVFGFRDFITVKAVDEAGGSKLSILARPRVNGYDWGVNAKRLDRWLGELQQTLGG